MPTRAERDRAVKMYTETRLPVGEIATRMGVSRSSIHRWLQSAGVELRGPIGPRKTYEGAEPRLTMSESEAIVDALRGLTERVDRLIEVLETRATVVDTELRRLSSFHEDD